MNIIELWAEIESEEEWRQAEIRFFQNQLIEINSYADQDKFRRALVLLLYAHFEGFCKFAFSLYISAINSLGITCGEVNFAIAAVSLDDLFFALRDPARRCDEFKRTLPDDTSLHRFARDREFIEQSMEFQRRPVCIPDKVVDTESNLKPVVLRKILYRLGFQYDQFSDLEGDIQMLLRYRNDISHGESKDGIPSDKYGQLKNAAFKIMDQVKSEIMTSLQKKSFLRNI
jgi:hypothetical protein